jgi:hypothetical protein
MVAGDGWRGGEIIESPVVFVDDFCDVRGYAIEEVLLRDGVRGQRRDLA